MKHKTEIGVGHQGWIQQHDKIAELEEKNRKLIFTARELYRELTELKERLGLLEEPVSPTD